MKIHLNWEFWTILWNKIRLTKLSNMTFVSGLFRYGSLHLPWFIVGRMNRGRSSVLSILIFFWTWVRRMMSRHWRMMSRKGRMMSRKLRMMSRKRRMMLRRRRMMSRKRRWRRWQWLLFPVLQRHLGSWFGMGCWTTWRGARAWWTWFGLWTGTWTAAWRTGAWAAWTWTTWTSTWCLGWLSHSLQKKIQVQFWSTAMNLKRYIPCYYHNTVKQISFLPSFLSTKMYPSLLIVA